MRKAGIALAGALGDLLETADVVVDCTPKNVAARNVAVYRQQNIKLILQGGEKHEVTGHSFVGRELRERDRPRLHPRRLVQHDVDGPHTDGAQARRAAPEGSRDFAAAGHRPVGEPSRRHHEHTGART